MRKLVRLAGLLRNHATNSATTAGAELVSAERPLQRFYSKLPAEYERYYGGAQPVRRAASGAAAEAVEVGGGTPAAVGVDQQRQNAAVVSRWMFPWEKRQMDEKGPLKTWERVYWGIFVGAIALLLFNRISGQKSEPVDPEVEREKEQRKLKAARLLLAGQTMGGEDDDDEFEGLSPQEIQSYVEKALGKNASADPFEGMSPEEINAMMENQQQR